eukprot:scaffold40_cov66-Phaeocystis_antarctica.AAC.1
MARLSNIADELSPGSMSLPLAYCLRTTLRAHACRDCPSVRSELHAPLVPASWEVGGLKPVRLCWQLHFKDGAELGFGFGFGFGFGLGLELGLVATARRTEEAVASKVSSRVAPCRILATPWWRWRCSM